VTNSNEIRVALVGVGNCANSLVQGVTYYKDAAADQDIPGLMHPVVGGYHINSIKFVLALDVDAKKVGLDLADAIWASENNTIKFADVAKTGITVQRGKTLDGLGRYYKETIKETSAAEMDVVKALKDERVDVTSPLDRKRRQSSTRNAHSTQKSHSSMHFQYLLPRIQFGQISSPRPGFRLLATTSRARWERPSHIES